MRRFHVNPTKVTVHRWTPASAGVTGGIVIPTKVGIHRSTLASAGVTRNQ